MHALVDSGTTDCLLSSMFAAKMGLTPHWLANLLQLSNIDGTLVAGGVQHCATFMVKMGERKVVFLFMITDELDGDIILGYPWLKEFEPTISWKLAMLDMSILPIIISEVSPTPSSSQALVPSTVHPPTPLSSVTVAPPTEPPSSSHGLCGRQPREGGDVMIGLVTSMQDALTCAPRAEEVEEVTAMLGRLQVKEEDLSPHKGNWAYHKSSPSPDNLPSPTHSTIEDVLPEEWDKALNLPESKEEEEGEPLNSRQKALIAVL